VIQGTIPSVCHAGAVATLLDARDIRMFDYGPLFADPFRQSIRSHVDRLAAKEGLEVEYIKKPKGYRKEDRIREIVAKRGSHPHILSVMELCSSYRPWHDKRTGMTYLRGDGGKCVYYYFYFIDEVLGLCFLSVPTCRPFRAQFYFNGHNWLASKLRAAGISFEMRDNASPRSATGRKLRSYRTSCRSPRSTRAWMLPWRAMFRIWLRSALPLEHLPGRICHRHRLSSADDLVPLYDHLLRTAIHVVKFSDIATFPVVHPISQRTSRSVATSRSASTVPAYAITSDPPRSRCTTSTASFFASRPRPTTAALAH
jgi:hypothetical protein